MARAYSLDLRERVVAAVSAGKSCGEAAEQFAVSRSSAIKWSRRKRETGSAAPAKVGGHRPFLLAGHKDWIAGRIAEKPDLTVQALLDELKAKGTVVSFDTLWRFLRGLGMTFKKNRSAKRAGSA
jgi:transposase